MPQLHMPLQIGLRPAAQGDAPLLPQRALPRHHRPRPRRDARRGDHHRHHRRLPRRDRRRPRAPRSTSCAQARFASAFTFQYSPRPGTPAATMRRPGAARGRAGALRPSSPRSSTRSPGTRTRSRSGARVELLVAEGEGRKDGATAAAVRPRARQPARALRAGRAELPRPGDVVDRRGHLRRAAPPRERPARPPGCAAPVPATPGRRARPTSPAARPPPASADRCSRVCLGLPHPAPLTAAGRAVGRCGAWADRRVGA